MKARVNLFLALSFLCISCSTNNSADLAKAVNAIIDQMSVPTSLVALSDSEALSTCSTSGNISSFTHNCAFSASPGTSATCNGTTYTWTDGSVELSAVRPEANLYTVTATISASLSGGDLVGTKAISCTFSADYTLNTTTNFLKTNPIIDNCSNFTCSVGGETLSCEELKLVIGQNPCSSTN